MFTAKILLANILVPTVVSTLAALIAKFGGPQKRASVPSEESSDSRDDAASAVSMDRSLLDIVIGAIAAALSIYLAFGLRNEFIFYAQEDAWLRIPFGTLMVAIGGLLTGPIHWGFKWVVRLGVVAWASWIVFPQGEAWGFLQESQTFWLVSLTLSSFIAWIVLESRAARDSGWLALCWIPCFAASAFLAAQSFMKVTEPQLAYASIIGCLGIAAILLERGNLIRSAAGPAVWASAASTASAQFNSYLELSDYLPGLAIFSPAIIAFSSLFLMRGRRTIDAEAEHSQSLKKSAIVITLTISLALAAAVVVWTQVLSGGGEEEW